MLMKKRNSRRLEYLLVLCAVWAAGLFIILALENARPILLLAAIVSGIIAAAVWMPQKAAAAAEFCFRYRWAIALLLFLLCVALRISGSSIGVYDEIFPTQLSEAENTWFGKARGIRSDEFGVQTPKFFSQAFNDYGLYSSRMSLSPTNMVLDYYSPVRDWTALGKPLMWGYLLFGSTVGLSWYWCGMIILLFMTALEMALILTEGCRWVSLLGAITVTLSPAIQWWVLPHMPIVILYSMSLFCIGYYFFTAVSRPGKWLCAVLAAVAAVGFVLSVFPSFQVPCAYAVAALLAVCLWRDRAGITFRAREWYRIALPAAVAAGILVNFLAGSRGDLAALMNTAYPGVRMNTGGANTIRDLFTDLTSLYLPYHGVPYSNNCEVSTYIHFAPLVLVLFPRMSVFLKRRRSSALPVGIALTVILVLYGFYMCVGIPALLAKLTFLKYCNRMKGVYGWLAALYTVWGLYVLAQYPEMLKRWQKILYPIVYGGICILLPDGNAWGYFDSFGTLWRINIGTVLAVGEVVLLAAILAAALFGRNRLTGWGLAVVMVVAGGTVNPVEHGTGAVTNHPLAECITELSRQDPDGLWLCTDCVFILSNYALANGARVLNATNFYPDEEKWQIIDPDEVYEEATNRYANQSTSISDGEVIVELVNPDYINYTLNPETVRKLGIRYLFSAVDYTELFSSHDIQCSLVESQDGYGIYQLSY